MKTFLMHPDRDFDAQPPSPKQPLPFAEDLELDVLLSAAAAGDRYLYDVMSAACFNAWANDSATIRYRQDVLKDCLANPSIVRQFYAIAIEPFSRDRSWNFSLYGRDASSMVGSGVRTLQSSLDVLARLRNTCSANASRFASQGFRQFFDTLERDLDDDYLAAARADLNNLTFRHGLLLSAQVGDGGKGVGTTLRKPQPRDLSWMRRTFTPGTQSFTLQLHPRDEAGAQAFGELQNRGLSLISDAVYQSAEHVLHFLKALRAELAFYVGCLNLKEQLDRIGEPIAFPDVPQDEARFRCRNLRDACLALTMGRPVVGNDVDGDGKQLVIITGANRGGKSTFLRSVGLAQLMLQCGMFVTADAFASSLHTGLFTHYKREEDRAMRSGKFDEELVRMSTIADHIHRRSLGLFNESFAATHEQEGSEIARQIVSALLDNSITVFFVSHMYEFARSFLDDDRVLFLRADRGDDGARSFRLREAKPLPKSFGADLYNQIFQPQILDANPCSRAPNSGCDVKLKGSPLEAVTGTEDAF
jgi:MutS domain V